VEHPFKAFRKSKALSVEKAAEELGVSKATVSRLENGKQGVSADLMRRISEWTGGQVTPNDLVGIGNGQ
jgi:transcriptional regulator with XRE-family HTH domain